ncbi:MAG: HAD family hydrolase [Calditrichaeota bacterium]|nr:MAG: HAD family hydrolase [Calditrichota bacterium]
MEKAIFLDRDGTINEEMGYINHISRFHIFPFTFEALKVFKKCGYKLVVITNQAGLARGYFSEDVLRDVHGMLEKRARDAGVPLDKIYFCPHLPGAPVKKYDRMCNCRKPKTGMLEQARDELNIDLSRSVMIGDRYKDVLFGKKMGLKTVMVLTGYGKGEYTYQKEQWKEKPDIVADNLLDAAMKICQPKG